MQIGYIRVSTDKLQQDESFRAQQAELERAGCQKFYRDRKSGATMERPEFDLMLRSLRHGDVVIVWRLDRLSRSTRDLLKTVQMIHDAGASLRSLKEGWIDTTTPHGKLILTILAGLYEFDRDLLLQRLKEGRDWAREKGTRFGRPSKLTDKERTLVLKLHQRDGYSIAEIAELKNVSRDTIERIVRDSEAKAIAAEKGTRSDARSKASSQPARESKKSNRRS